MLRSCCLDSGHNSKRAASRSVRWDAASSRHVVARQLQQVVAPIAFDPDELVAQVLAATTYPTEVVEADRWLEKHSGLKGEELAKAVDRTWGVEEP